MDAPRPSSLACDECRKKHLKCDSTTPPCTRCTNESLLCSYTPSRRGYRRRKTPWDSAKTAAAQKTSQHGGTSTPTFDLDGMDLNPSLPLKPGDATPPGQNGSGIVPSDAAVFSAEAPTDTPQTTATNRSVELTRQEEERLVHLYYTHFHATAPILVPRRRYATQAYPAHLKAVVHFIGSHYTPAFDSNLLHDAVEVLLSPPQEPALHTTQALLLLSIAQHARAYHVNALATLSRATEMAIELKLHLRDAPVRYGGLDPLLQESVKRTWWEVYCIEGYLAAVHRQPSFRCNSVLLEALLPCEENAYRDGLEEPQSITLEQYDARFFADHSVAFSSACYRIEAIRILARVLALTAATVDGPDDIQSVDNAIVAWKLHLPDDKATAIDRCGDVDQMMLQAFAFMHTATVFLHFPRSELLLRVPTAADIECASAMVPASPTSAQHATKAIVASKELSDLAALPVSKYSPLFTCALVFGCIVQLSACSAHAHSCIFQHRDRVALMTGALKSLRRHWPVAGQALRKLNTIASGIFNPAQSKQSGTSSPTTHDSGIGMDATMGDLCWFDLFPPRNGTEDFTMFGAAPDVWPS
ncbi:hypothetical protein D0863_13811 [Hortaea werneckii]|uniref:Zn(2)-C6 fungal-type domain-containing protein n=1 Tax=Hortaea werneckii TaxID=91943 RepID=A0A3M7CQD3_HORWE|nr:hypothetical protein D0863_13811 [Hortaea werneckii]